MLVTGESTGQLGTMMEKVSVHFGNLHKNAINMLKTLIEPITIAFFSCLCWFHFAIYHYPNVRRLQYSTIKKKGDQYMTIYYMICFLS